MTDERVDQIRAEFGLTEQEAAARHVRVLLARLAEADVQVTQAGLDLVDRARKGIEDVDVRTTWTSLGGAPLHAGVELAARYDYALVRLSERVAALTLIADAIKDSR